MSQLQEGDKFSGLNAFVWMFIFAVALGLSIVAGGIAGFLYLMFN